MERILKLSLSDRNFTVDPTPLFPTESNPGNVIFKFDEFIPVAMKLLSIDANLSQIHAKVCPKMDNEELFWRNYYYRVRYIRGAYGIEGQAVRDLYKQINEEYLIFPPLVLYTEPPEGKKEAVMDTVPGSSFSTPIVSGDARRAANSNNSINSINSSSSPVSSTSVTFTPKREGLGIDSSATSLAGTPLKEEPESKEETARKIAQAALDAEVEAELENEDLDLDLNDLDDFNIDDVDADYDNMDDIKVKETEL